MDNVDLTNAVKLLVDNCDSRKTCSGCPFEDGDYCKFDGRDPLEWNIYGDEDQEEKV